MKFYSLFVSQSMNQWQNHLPIITKKFYWEQIYLHGKITDKKYIRKYIKISFFRQKWWLRGSSWWPYCLVRWSYIIPKICLKVYEHSFAAELCVLDKQILQKTLSNEYWSNFLYSEKYRDVFVYIYLNSLQPNLNIV